MVFVNFSVGIRRGGRITIRALLYGCGGGRRESKVVLEKCFRNGVSLIKKRDGNKKSYRPVARKEKLTWAKNVKSCRRYLEQVGKWKKWRPVLGGVF